MDFSKVKKINIGGKDVKTISINSQVVWKKKDDEPNYFYVENINNVNNNLSLKKVNTSSTTEVAPSVVLEESDDGKVWRTWDVYNTPLTILPNAKKYLRGNNNVFGVDYWIYNNFDCTYNYNIGGDITSLLDVNANVLNLGTRNECFYGLFRNSKKLINAKDLILKSEILSQNCYRFLFGGCSNLITAPILTSTKLASNCYSSMFSDCSSLIECPDLPKAEMEGFFNAYTNMFENCILITKTPILYDPYTLIETFKGCTNLNTVTIAAKTWTKMNNNWLDGVSPTGTFYKPKELIVGDGDGQIPISSEANNFSGIPAGWTIIDQ